MRKADKIKLSVMVGVSLLAFVVGCVDTAVQPIPTSIDYKSDVNIVNLAAGTGAGIRTGCPDSGDHHGNPILGGAVSWGQSELPDDEPVVPAFAATANELFRKPSPRRSGVALYVHAGNPADPQYPVH